AGFLASRSGIAPLVDRTSGARLRSVRRRCDQATHPTVQGVNHYVARLAAVCNSEYENQSRRPVGLNTIQRPGRVTVATRGGRDVDLELRSRVATSRTAMIGSSKSKQSGISMVVPLGRTMGGGMTLDVSREGLKNSSHGGRTTALSSNPVNHPS